MFALSIRTERLTLRPYTLADAPRVQLLAGEWDVARMVSSVPHPYPDGLAESWIGMHDAVRAAGRGYPFAVTRGDELIGSAGVDRRADGALELGYWLGKPYWGAGYMSEAAAAVVDFAMGWLAAPHIVAGALAENPASLRILTKLGFAATGVEERESKSRYGLVACNMLALSRAVWSAKRV
ncbi:MAG: GNAT family N-acetyltransferase [Rhodospirillaceae bacterium]|nr:GNAT family N-acetyltransferase [Rhodospirillaceae bacterium]